MVSPLLTGKEGGPSSFCKPVADKGVGVAVPEPVLVLEESDKFHVFRTAGTSKDSEPMPDRMPIGTLNRWEVGRWTLDLWRVRLCVGGHREVSSNICPIRMAFPNGSRIPKSMPYGFGDGSSVMSTPRSRSVANVA